MRTVFALLAALGAVSSANALAAFDKTTCATSIPGSITASISSNGAWNCFDFSVASSIREVVTMDVPIGMAGAQLQVYAWNSAQQGGTDAGDSRWTSGASSSWLFFGTPQNGQTDLNEMPTAWTDSTNDRYAQVVTAKGTNVLSGWTSAHRTGGVYAYYSNGLSTNPGRNILALKNPGTATGQSSFDGKLLWRFVYPDVAGVDAAVVPSGDLTSSFSALNVGSAVAVNNLVSPGTGFSLQVGAQFAQVGWAIEGFQYTARVSQTGLAAGNLSANAWMGNNPMVTGWAGLAGANTTGTTSTGVTLHGNYSINNPATYGPAAGNISHTVTTGVDLVTRTWDLPLDFTPVSGQGMLAFEVPSFMQWGVDWTQQVSPFLDVTLTITWVKDYPMLSSLSNAVFRNWDTDTVLGHNLETTHSQVPSRVYRVQTNAMWWRAKVTFNGVENLNRPTGVGAATAQPACDPLWEVQAVSDWDSKNVAGGNGFGKTWYSTATVNGNFGWMDFHPNSNANNWGSSRWMTNTYWAPGASNFGLLPDISTSRNVWLLVRISAVKNVDASGTAKACGSNWVRVGSASFSTSGITDQCAAASDCLTEAADNPNKDAAESSANSGIQFSSCVVVPTLGPEGTRIPTTKCLECIADNQCGDAQYCHLDNGMCQRNGLPGTNSWYNCDADSGKLMGLCVAKSPEVLNQKCRSAWAGAVGSTPSASGMVYPTTSAPSIDGNEGNPTASGTMNDLFAFKGDAAAPFAKGGTGACGEWRFYNGSAPYDDSGSEFISSANRPRYALWTGICHRGVCKECYPGSAFGRGGKICLNGRTYAAMDVDGTVRTFAEDTGAGTELGTTAMVILLLIVFWMYMYAEAKRWRAANGKGPMSCCECLCCCDACTKFDAPAKA